jgi:SHS2 domain-containing protein
MELNSDHKSHCSTNAWEHFAHPADMGIRGLGMTRQEAYAQAALALTALTVDLDTIKPCTCVTVRCDEADMELLLPAWLNAILFEMATRHMVFSRFSIDLEPGGLRAELWGETLDPARHHPSTEVKAATYAALRVEQQPTGQWMAQCIVDM